MEHTDILVIGGSAAGVAVSLSSRMKNPDKKIILLRREENVMIPCGIPYIFGTVKTSEKNILPDSILENANVEIRKEEATIFDPKARFCMLANGDKISYDKLIVATGSEPVKPKWLQGVDFSNVYNIPKNKKYLDQLQLKINDAENIVVVGAGFIGVELADELNKTGKHVTLVEKLPHILGLAFDEEFAEVAEELLKNRGVDVLTGTGIQSISGNGKADAVFLENGKVLPADIVILSMGYQPNTELARASGLEINERGFIKVDEYLRTSKEDVFAVGDCAEKKDYFTRKTSSTMLASTACAEARIVGLNLYKLSTPKCFGGTIAIYSTAIGDTAFATAGMNEKMANWENYEIVTGVFKGPDKHPGSLPGTNTQMVKLIASRDTKTILGGEVMGGSSTGELINVIGIAIENKMTLSSLLTSQIGTHPLLTGSPVGYPLIKAAEMACKNIARSWAPQMQ